MSVDAVAWALRWAPVANAQEHVLLIALADRADEFGRAAWPYQDDLAARGRCSIRTARRHLAAMEKRGLIARGDQRLVAHLRSDRRPIVWDLDLSKRLPETPFVAADDASEVREDNLSPRSEGVVSTSAGRPDNMTGRTNGVSDAPNDRPENLTGRTQLWSSDRTELCPPIRTERPSSSGHLGGVTHVAREGDEPPPPRCPEHVNHPNPPACGGCADARREREQFDAEANRARIAQQSAEKRRAAEDRARAIANCGMCDADGYLTVDGAGALCSHDPDEAERGARGMANLRATMGWTS